MKIVENFDQLLIAYSTTAEGNMDERFSDRSVVMANRRKFLNHFSLNPKLIVEGKQIHHQRILVLDSENTKMWYGLNIPGVDGFITNQNSVGMVIKVADCVPVVLYDPEHQAVALLHAGWQGANKNIHGLGLKKMTEQYGSDPSKVMVWIGPNAKNEYYSTDKPAQIEDELWQPYIVDNHGSWQVNVEAYVINSLKNLGIKAANITVDSENTVTSEELYSYTRSKQTQQPEGRFLVLVKLR